MSEGNSNTGVVRKYGRYVYRPREEKREDGSSIILMSNGTYVRLPNGQILRILDSGTRNAEQKK